MGFKDYSTNVLRKVLPLKLKSSYRNHQKFRREYGNFFRLRLLRQIISTRDLRTFQILLPQWGIFRRGLSLTSDISFLKDTKFMTSYEKAIDNQLMEIWQVENDSIIWRAHLLCWFLDQNVPEDGDWVECGVWYGWLSKTLIEYCDFEKKSNSNFYLIDGWDAPTESHKIYSHSLSNRNPDFFDFVNRRFDYSNVKLVKGWIPEVFELSDFPRIDKVAFLSIDMNGWKAERAALDYFYPRLVTGAVIYFDDYGHNYPGLVQMVDEFFSDKPEKPLYFPCGSVIFIKQ